MFSVSKNLAGIPWVRKYNGLGDFAVNNTVSKMKDIINSSYKNPYVRRWAEKILQDAHVPSYDWIGEAMAIHNWVRDHVRYTHDPAGLEYLQTPPTLLQLIERGETPMGDCDDMTMLTLSLLKSLGYNVALRVAAYNKNGTYQHVYGLVKVATKTDNAGNGAIQQWVTTDTIKPSAQLGFEAPNKTRYFTVKV